jgi:hypothetical protein
VSDRRNLFDEVAVALEELLAFKPASKPELPRWYELARTLEKKLTESGGLSSEVPSLLWNYLADADVRLKDSVYGDLQNRQVRLLIRYLKRGEMPTDAELKQFA